MTLKNELAIGYERKLTDLKLKLRQVEQIYQEQQLKSEFEQKGQLMTSAKKASDQEKEIRSQEKEIQMGSSHVKELGQEME